MSVATVFILRWSDPEVFQRLYYDLPQRSGHPRVPLGLREFDGTPKGAWWEAPPVYSDRPRLREPDLWPVGGVAAIAMEQWVADELAEHVFPVGELLPLRWTSRTRQLLLLNILRDVDCLDPASYSPDDLRADTTFLEHRLPESGLFKVPQLDTVEIFYLERSDEQDTLRDALEHHELTGIELQPVWASDGSVAPVNLMSPW